MPLENRDASRLLIRQRDGSLLHEHVINLPNLIPANALVIVNESRVIPSRIYGETLHGGRLEIMLLEPLVRDGSEPLVAAFSATSIWRAIGRPMRKMKPGSRILFPGNLEGTILQSAPQAAENLEPLVIEFPLPPMQFLEWLALHGFIPLPPYIRRDNPSPAASSPDTQRYQTIYSKEQGSVAAPTAGLHITPNLLERMRDRGIELASITLHVGGGTFLPVRNQDHTLHKMHEERFFVSARALNLWQKAKYEGRPIVVVGTTSLRTMESLLRLAKQRNVPIESLADRWHRTNLFLFPQNSHSTMPIECAQGLLTNFHQPQSTLFMLVASLIGLNKAQELYREAVAQRYRLFSYGDSSLLWL